MRTSNEYNRRVACKRWNVNEIFNQRDVTFEVLGGQQKCIEIYMGNGDANV